MRLANAPMMKLFLAVLFTCGYGLPVDNADHRTRREESIDLSPPLITQPAKIEEKEVVKETVAPFVRPLELPVNIFEVHPLEEDVQVCDETNAPGRSKIFCSGRLLEAVNELHLFNDSKTFVDMPIKANLTGTTVLAEFDARFPATIPTYDIDKDDLKRFVDAHFEPAGHELEACSLLDWTESPPSFARIEDPEMHQFALDLNNVWKDLCRKVKNVVKEDPERFSLLYVPHNFIAPGGRFREFYYWDAYWIVKGLIASGMTSTTAGMIRNFAEIVDKYGFIPNGGRIYYLQRSQPPLLTPMVYEYYQATRDRPFLEEMLPILEKEYDYWNTQRSVTVKMHDKNYTMYQYRTPANVPRPESYREDTLNAEKFPSEGRKQVFYRDLGSAAESGWDFSTRWFADKRTILSIHTTDVVPVDLNAFVCYNLHIISFLHGETGNLNKHVAWMKEYIKFRDDFQQVFYLADAKGWYDYDLKNRTHNTAFYPSIAAPLFTGCYDDLSMTQSDDLYDRMADLGAFGFQGGVPTSLANDTQEQWDFPNGWSPLNHMIIEGLRKTGNPRLQQKAFGLAQKWIRSNYHVYKVDRAMWEKYNVATNEPRTGGGGEYEVQAGFGWSNGVVLDLLLSYGDRIKDEPTEATPPAEIQSLASDSSHSAQQSSTASTLAFITLMTLMAVLLQ